MIDIGAAAHERGSWAAASQRTLADGTFIFYDAVTLRGVCDDGAVFDWSELLALAAPKYVVTGGASISHSDREPYVMVTMPVVSTTVASQSPTAPVVSTARLFIYVVVKSARQPTVIRHSTTRTMSLDMLGRNYMSVRSAALDGSNAMYTIYDCRTDTIVYSGEHAPMSLHMQDPYDLGAGIAVLAHAAVPPALATYEMINLATGARELTGTDIPQVKYLGHTSIVEYGATRWVLPVTAPSPARLTFSPHSDYAVSIAVRAGDETARRFTSYELVVLPAALNHPCIARIDTLLAILSDVCAGKLRHTITEASNCAIITIYFGASYMPDLTIELPRVLPDDTTESLSADLDDIVARLHRLESADRRDRLARLDRRDRYDRCDRYD